MSRDGASTKTSQRGDAAASVENGSDNDYYSNLVKKYAGSKNKAQNQMMSSRSAHGLLNVNSKNFMAGRNIKY